MSGSQFTSLRLCRRSLTLGLAVLKDYDPRNLVHLLLSAANVMSFWVLALRSIGLARLCGVSAWKSGVWVFGIWAFYTGALILFSVGIQKLFGG